MSDFKVGDKVKCKLSERGIFTVYQIIDQVVFLNVGCSIEPFKLSDLEKVEEKTAPPKFTKVYVWNGEKPKFPKIMYSLGEPEGNKIKVFGCEISGTKFDIYQYENWEIIG